MAPVSTKPRYAKEWNGSPSISRSQVWWERGRCKVYAEIDKAARESGFEIDWAAIERIPNTLDAHRLIHWAGLEQKQTLVVAGLFRAYWQEGRDIGAHDVLADIADSAGMDAAVVHRLLATDADAEDIVSRDAHSRERGVTSVPTFIIANQHVVPGAQPVELWQQLIDEIAGQL